ncbi:MAG: type II toxin-antitoxin system VapC family toxin [Acidobacteria bacterium]|nr:type II toxin-antitoxin system VapC family toxin [Acidobacteriota bacterium]
MGQDLGSCGEVVLSIYDAVYLELALRKALPLASRDAALNEAARAAGVNVLS